MSEELTTGSPRQGRRIDGPERLGATDCAGGEHYRRLIGLLPVAVYTCELSGVITYYNEHAAALWGRSPRIGDTDERFCGSFKLWRSDGTPMPHDQTPMAVALREGQAFRNEDVTIERPDGTQIHVLVNIDPIRDAQGRVVGAINAFHDTTALNSAQEALRESEERYRAIVEGQAEMICLFRPEGTVLFANGAYSRAMGMTSETITGTNFWEFIAEEDRPAVRALLDHLSPQTPEVCIENRIGSGGGVRWTLWTNRGLMFDSNGKATQVQSCGIDITARKQAEEALRQARDELERRVAERTAELAQQTERLQKLAHELASTEHRERKRLAAILHDELQQYLVALRLQLTRARDQMDGQAVTAALGGCVELLDQAVICSRDLIHTLRPPVLYEDGLVPALRWLAMRMLETHRLTVDVDAEKTLIPLDEDVRAMLYESVRELLLNTVKHAAVSQAAIIVRRDADWLRITVRDRGAGFDVSTVSQPRRMDRGLGLFSIGERMTAIGGALKIASEPGRGAQITLELPLAVTDDGQAEAATAPVTARQALPPLESISKPPADEAVRVLVVDDHVIVREGIVNLLEGVAQVKVIGQASNGIEALAAVERYQPDIVLMDVNMPRMNGIEATRQIRKRWPHVRVLGLSVQGDAATEKSMLEAGAMAFVSKSDDTRHLIQTVLNWRQASLIISPVSSHRRIVSSSTASTPLPPLNPGLH